MSAAPLVLPVATRAERHGRLGALDAVVLVAAVANVVPLLLVTHLVTTDGPAHLLSAVVLTHHDLPVYRLHYVVDWSPAPNLLTEVLLAGLTRLAAPATAEKVLAAVYAVGFPLSLWWAARGLRRDAGWVGVLALPLTYGYLFWYGFYNFCYGLALFCVTTGWALRHAHRWRPASAAVAALLLALTWYTHLVAFGMALLAVVVLSAAAARREHARRPLLYAAAAALPSVVLTAVFARTGTGALDVRWLGLPSLVVRLVTLTRPIVALASAEQWAAGALAALMAVGVVVAVRRRAVATPTGTGALALLVGLSVVLALASPQQLNHDYGMLDDRLSYFPPLLLALWLGARLGASRLRWPLTAGTLAVAAALAALQLPAQRFYDRQLTEYLTATRAIRPGSTLVALRFFTDTPRGHVVRGAHQDPMLHASSRLAAAVHGIDLDHYVAELPYFPTRFRPGTDLRRAIDPTLRGLEKVPPQVDLSVPAAARIDDVLVIGAAYADPRDPSTARLLAQLRAGWHLVETTAPTGLVQVWARDR